MTSLYYPTGKCTENCKLKRKDLKNQNEAKNHPLYIFVSNLSDYQKITLIYRLQVKQPMFNGTMECSAISNNSDFVTDGSNSSSICLEPDVPHFDDFKIFTHTLLVLYLLIAHVMLLNLLIAIFT